MIRRSFRFGLVVGLVAGAAVAIAKLFGVRPDAAAPADGAGGEPWPALSPEPIPSPAPTRTTEAAPAAPAWTPPPAAEPTSPAWPPAPTEAPTPAWAPSAAEAPSPAPEPAAAWAPSPAEAPSPSPAPEPAAAPVPPPEPPAPTAPTPVKKAPARKATVKAWVEPTGTVCPTSHPVKAKLTSKIFHLPGMLNYERTHPDRCYLNAAKAEADGLRPSKR